jgi:hypothetical protein
MPPFILGDSPESRRGRPQIAGPKNIEMKNAFPAKTREGVFYSKAGKAT